MLECTLKLYCDEGKSITDIAAIENVSKSTVRYYLKKFNIKTRLSLEYVCACGVTGAENFHPGRKTTCKSCRNIRRMERINEGRKFALDLLGGKCRSCGYDKYPCSLDIHHTLPEHKDPNFKSIRSWSKDRIIKELETCVLLCSNCHAAYHAGYDIKY